MMNLHSNSLFLAARGRTKLSFSSHAGLEASPRTRPLRWDVWWWWWWWWWEREFCFIRGQRWCELLIMWWRSISGYSTGSSHQLSPCWQGWSEAERRTLWQNNLFSLAKLIQGNTYHYLQETVQVWRTISSCRTISNYYRQKQENNECITAVRYSDTDTSHDTVEHWLGLTTDCYYKLVENGQYSWL